MRDQSSWWEKIKAATEPKLDEPDYAFMFDDTNTEPPRSRTRDEIARMIERKNPVRWRYLKRDFKWAQKQAVKLGLNPEDVRWLL